MNVGTWVSIGVALLATAAGVGATDRPLREGDITESAVLDGLLPAQRASGTQSRGYRPASKQVAPNSQRVSLMVTFVTDSAELQPSARRALDIVARALQSELLAGRAFRIEGHADPRGSAAHNLDLSARRAESVAAYLSQSHGIAADRLEPVGRGATDLLLPGNPAAPENRRVTVVVK